MISPEYPVSDPVPGPPANGNQTSPSVAFDGTNYLVAWQDYRSGTTSDIYGARVSQAGAVLDPAGIAISTAANDQSAPERRLRRHELPRRLAGLPLRHDWDDIYGARVSQAGAVLDPAGIAISTAADGQLAPSVAFDGTNYLVAWQDIRSGTTTTSTARA